MRAPAPPRWGDAGATRGLFGGGFRFLGASAPRASTSSGWRPGPKGSAANCASYEIGLRRRARAIISSGPASDPLSATGTAVLEVDSPLGTMLLAASPQGLTRVAFDDHADLTALRAHASRRRGGQAARRHLSEAALRRLGELFGRNPIPVFMPCHRVRRGSEIPSSFVGGAVRRSWLDSHEQSHTPA